MSVTELKTKTPEGVIEALEETLAAAREGDMRALMLVELRMDGGYTLRFRGVANTLEKIGILEATKHELLTNTEDEQ
jgi:hypothetical protein